MAQFEGVYVAIVTPFTQSYEVDEQRLFQFCQWLIEEGVHGLVPTGSLGEYATLTPEERSTVVETVIAAADDRVPVLVGTGASSTSQAIGWAEHAKEKGAAGIMALPPINYNPLENEVIAHYEALSAVGLPIIAYNNPHDYPTDLTPELLAKIARFDAVVGVKEFSGDVRRISSILEQTDLEVMVGVDNLALEGFLFGATGWIAGIPNALPKEGAKLYELAKAGNMTEAKALYRRLRQLSHYDASPQLVQSIKYMAELAGQPVGPTRPPRLPLSKDHYAEVEKDFTFALSATTGKP
jgi:1-pyrroline-4-hydroxy-2-carboxylate deaminase